MPVGYTLNQIIGLGFSELFGITFKESLGERIDTQPAEDDEVIITVTIDHIIDRQNLPNKMKKSIQMKYYWHDDIGETHDWEIHDLTQVNETN
jgi:hypothetical protein